LGCSPAKKARKKGARARGKNGLANSALDATLSLRDFNTASSPIQSPALPGFVLSGVRFLQNRWHTAMRIIGGNAHTESKPDSCPIILRGRYFDSATSRRLTTFILWQQSVVPSEGALPPRAPPKYLKNEMFDDLGRRPWYDRATVQAEEPMTVNEMGLPWKHGGPYRQRTNDD
jgi:hypothetical protein